MKSTLVMGAVLAAASFGAAAQPSYGAYRDSQIQAQQQYQAPQPGSEHYNPELDPRSPQYNPNNVPPGHAYSNDPQRSQYQQAPQSGYYDPRGYDPRPHARAYGPRFRAGNYAPEYRAERYWVRDWRARQLDRPPQGHRWVQAESGDVLLMALDTGRIARVVRTR